MGGRALRTIVAAVALAPLAFPAASEAARTVYISSRPTAPTGVAAFGIGDNGGLTPLTGSPFAAGTGPAGLAMTPDARYLYATDPTAATPVVIGFSADSGGSLSTLTSSPFPEGSSNRLGMAITPEGRFMYTTQLSGSATINGYAIGGDGALAKLSGSPFDPRAAGAQEAGVVVSPNGSHLYVANLRESGGTPDHTISGFSIAADGALSKLTGSPFDVGSNYPSDLVMTPDGTRLYSVNFGDANGSVAGFTVSADGSLKAVPGSPYQAVGATPLGATMTPDGRRLYISSLNGHTVSGFDIASDGSLTAVPGSPVNLGAATQPAGIAVAPDGHRLYVSEGGTDHAFGFDISADGSLAQVPGSPFATGVGQAEFESLLIAPDQPPTATFTASSGGAGFETTFDATGSTDPDGAVGRYDWNFGDGSALDDGGPTPSHTYARAGAFSVTLTLTDNEGCSTSRVFTGQVALCNGGSSAKIKTQVTIPDVVDPKLRLRRRKGQRLGPAVAVRGTCSEPCRAKATGKLVVKGAGRGHREARGHRGNRYRLFPARAKLFNGRYDVMRLKLPPRVLEAVSAALHDGASVTAKVAVKATDLFGNKSNAVRRRIKLRR